MLDLSISEFALLVAALAGAGLITGLLAGLLGIGGGGVLVPVLFDVFRAIGVDDAVRMHLAVGTALAVIIPTSLRSFTAHRAKGAVDMDIVRSMAIPVVIGVLLGSVIARYLSDVALKIVWIVTATIMAVKLIGGRADWRLGDDIPGQPFRFLYGTFIGVISTLMSIGGGVFVTTMMTLYGRTIHQAVATSSGFGPMIAIPGAIGFAWAGWGASGLPPGSLGYVSLLGAMLIVPASVLAAPIGVRLAHGFERRTLELAFGGFLTIIALRFLISLIA